MQEDTHGWLIVEVQRFRSRSELGPTWWATDHQWKSREREDLKTDLMWSHCHQCYHHAPAAAAAVADDDDDVRLSCRSEDRGCRLHWTNSRVSSCRPQLAVVWSARQLHNCQMTTRRRWRDVVIGDQSRDCLASFAECSRHHLHSLCSYQSAHLPTWLFVSPTVSEIQPTTLKRRLFYSLYSSLRLFSLSYKTSYDDVAGSLRHSQNLWTNQRRVALPPDMGVYAGVPGSV